MKRLIPFQKGLATTTILAAAALCASGFSSSAQTGSATNTGSPKKDRLSELFGDPVVAKGKGFEIKQSQLDAEVLRTKEAYAAGQRALPADIDARVLDGMIGLKLLLARSTDADRTKAKTEFDKQLNAFKSDRKMSDEEFNERLAPQLKIEGRSRAEWEQQQVEQGTIPVVVQRELNTPLTDDQAKKFYDDNVSKFEEPELLRVAHILISTHDATDPNPNMAQKRELPDEQKRTKRKLADDLVKRARGGEDFAKMARDYSDDTEVKQNNGEIKISRDAFAPEEFKAAAFALKSTNQVSDVTTSVLGYHVIKLLERIPARKEPYAGLDTKTIYQKPDGQKYTIRDFLNEETIRKQLPDLIKKLRAEAGVEILEPKLRVEEPVIPAGISVPGQK